MCFQYVIPCLFSTIYYFCSLRKKCYTHFIRFISPFPFHPFIIHVHRSILHLLYHLICHSCPV
ncbi:hypothetical protein MtrunA17_Chr7g0242371 [Medicago truncatula]|uniref:Uncharacterized protein n=1 Tax=Medicago truncatula TaxID=3880 RepID=A0A396H154_MEDTR|nr:hypothetical protein MtrunA17_Chr7g0242371 [Medicago truncatula]